MTRTQVSKKKGSPSKSTIKKESTALKPAAISPKRMMPPASGVAVRMYRQGLGDCFLLAFPTDKADEAFYMLIDCGVILGTSEPEAVMTRVAEDIEAATGGDIHLLAVTHEHWDHVSGFAQARTVFERMRIHNLWLAWTEDPEDDLGNKLRADFAKDREALNLAVSRAFDGESVEQVTNLLQFFGDTSSDNTLGAAKRNNTKSALEAVREFAAKTDASPNYRRPGEGPLKLPKIDEMADVSGVRVYILGPPHDEKILRRINPSAKGKEVYTDHLALTPRTSFLMAVRDEAELTDDERALRDLSYPFEQGLRISIDEAEKLEVVQSDGQKCNFFAEHYGAGRVSQTATRIDKPANDWRRIDDDWLGASSEIALQLDSYTNNTSLVMAIELIQTGKILLFVADAQVGNWLSWDALSWQVKSDADPVTSADLLKRTVLYKVGHHGSHNATIRAYGAEQKGLELMTNSDLVAMIPVNHQMAIKKGWVKMPFNPLMKRLAEKTKHRLLQVDDPFPKPKPDEMSETEWEIFKGGIQETELYLQYTIAD